MTIPEGRPVRPPDGVAVVDKAAGWTSHDVVAKARGLLGTRKIGHAGTLDPDATGVLVLGVGRGTRLLRFLSPLGKAYVGEVVLGVETSTLDAAGEVTATHDMDTVTLDQVRAAATQFRGPILQVPPMVSALKVEGRRLHELARAGVEVERRARPVTVDALDIRPVPGQHLVYEMAVECSSGTYVRTLAADLGAALGGGAHLRNLRRTAVGSFTLDTACPIEALGPERLLPLRAAVSGLATATVDDLTAAGVATGKVLPLDALGGGEGPWAVVDGSGELLAVYEPYGEALAKPMVVVAGRRDD